MADDTGQHGEGAQGTSDRRGFFKAAALGAVAGAAHGKFGSALVSPAQAQGAPAPRMSERPW